MSKFDDFDEFDPSTPNAGSWSANDLEPVGAAEFGAPMPVMVRSCGRLGMQATPRPTFSDWLWRR